MRAKARYFGIGFRLVFAFSVLAFSTILVSSVSYSTFNETLNRLTEIQQEDMVSLEEAARLNDLARTIISTSFIILSAESDQERDQAMQEIERSLSTMSELMVDFPDYNQYFKNLINQINYNLSLLYTNEVKMQVLNTQFKDLLSGLFPFLIATDQWLSQLNDTKKTAINHNELRRLLHYQFGLAEKLYNDLTFNELDNTILRLEKVGSNWWEFWQAGQLENTDPSLNKRLVFINNMMSRQGKLFNLKNQQIDLNYQQKFLWGNSRLQLHQLAVQVESYAKRVNQQVDSEIDATEQRLLKNMKLALSVSFFSLCAAVFFSWFYVRNNILQRIRDLQSSMRLISSGKLNTPIQIKGHDEITEMAKDVLLFQANSLKLEQTNKQLITLQNELVQSGKLAALGGLSVGITHEINQPLTAVNSHLHSASIWLERQQLDKVKNSLCKIEKLIAKTSVITQHLKSFARKSDGKLEKVCVSSVITEALELLSSRIDYGKCKISYVPLDNYFVSANAIRLEQVMVNIIANALDAVEGVDDAHIHIYVTESDHSLCIKVKDNGEGIISEDLPHIFDPFFTKKMVGKGLGLGLSITFNIIKDFNGNLSVQSERGKGATFTIELKKLNEECSSDAKY
ncbi:ATP-binding protein [Psychromonas sp. SR45-3]|uniref:ATP-binding protein n=1 Tax=Psychromonas sp. SR45-3 TaxID=2760930 RepID=UPI0015F7BB62|nr:ATP-binding protein [Psychromonas sp. SR45-3]MBB1271276.1 GHKL domain-containing protein [Psychromonas sp. SR45-3]